MTSRLEAQIAVGCPFDQAAKRLDRFFRFASPVALVHAVDATIHVAKRARDVEPRYRIEWMTKDPGPFPMFSGELRVEGHGDRRSFTLVVKGEYEPAFQIVGESFDPAIGEDVASAIAIDLLRQIRSSVERDVLADEARASDGIGRLHLVDFGNPRTRIR